MAQAIYFAKRRPAKTNALGRLRTAGFLRTEFIPSSFFRFDPPKAQIKALAGAITVMHCSIIVAEMSTNSSKIHLGSILVNSAVRHNCWKIRENALAAPQSYRSS